MTLTNQVRDPVAATGPCALVGLTSLMELTSGKPEIIVAVIDGPVVTDHPDLTGATIHGIPAGQLGRCAVEESVACAHGTFVAGILVARRGSAAPAICPGCTLLLRPIFPEAASGRPPQPVVPSQRPGTRAMLPSARPAELAVAIIESVDAGARVINMSLGLTRLSSNAERELEQALDRAARRGVIVVAAAGNQATIGSSAITRHPWVIPVVACDAVGRPMRLSNLGSSIGRHGLQAPGEEITSLGPHGTPLRFGGTSVAAPFVTGAVALLWSLFPAAPVAEVRRAITQAGTAQRTTVVPPLLDAWGAYQVLLTLQRR
jgi:subtilisin family serine protease